ncbi:dynein light chain Tctex-type protein 2B isoform X3 [Bos taurus]|uniref:dynein light chain Tctex-type protein 2B isoform X3 n=1 Tax=Bos taurus TaxID=9913 RepID=UPI0028CBBFB6|nr:dynein light chain Tctex-type protein 2B isoform X3 [Bos taurus]
MRRRKEEGGESTLRRAGPTVQSAGPLHAGSKAALSPWRRLSSCRGHRLSFLCGKRGAKKLRLCRLPPPSLSTRPSLCARPLLQLTACLRLRTTLGSRRIPIFCGLFSSKEMGFDRYKMVVQVVIGEQRGEGVLTVYSVL